MARLLPLLALVAGAVAVPRGASAFCGVYVNGAGSEMFNNATQVVIARVGTRTVLSMQNNYQGPPDGFAMIVPVPAVLREENVKTLAHDIFAKVDALGSPRLVEYWEQDPCAPDEVEGDLVKPEAMSVDARSFATHTGGDDHGVTVEAQFAVGEYQIVILSAKESTGLDAWLREQNYKIPPGTEPLLRPYVVGGSKFFVAKVDTTKVKFVNGMAALSPLRFYYDSDELVLPIRLGLANSAGAQDLIVNMLGTKRFEVANYRNVFIPTNLDVRPSVRSRFGEFYAALFDKTIAANPGAVVTEYAWDAGWCDPCSVAGLDGTDFGTLGYDVISPELTYHEPIVLTRLHLRYKKGEIRDDLVFKQVPPVEGGRETRTSESNTLESGATPGDSNQFQARYAIRHRWTGKAACKEPQWGKWGGAYGGTPDPGLAVVTGAQIAFTARGAVHVDDFLDTAASAPHVSPGRHGCGCDSGSSAGMGIALVALGLRRRRRAHRAD